MFMTITRQTVAEQLAAYLHHQTPLARLVDWAENAVMAGEFTPALEFGPFPRCSILKG
jgi:hypothetical protein